MRAVDPGLALMVMPATAAERAAARAGLRPIREVYADRAYAPDLTLVPRSRPGAVIDDPEAALARVLRMVTMGEVVTADGAVRPVSAESVCVHGDGPAALGTARRLGAGLAGAGVAIAAA